MTPPAFTHNQLGEAFPTATGSQLLDLMLLMPDSMQAEASDRQRAEIDHERHDAWLVTDPAIDDLPTRKRAHRAAGTALTTAAVPLHQGPGPLLSIPSSVYVPALTGREPNGGGFVRCPFHAGGEENTPSLKTWDEPDRGWFCFGCSLGGALADFASRHYGVSPRGSGWFEIMRRLEADLRLQAAA